MYYLYLCINYLYSCIIKYFKAPTTTLCSLPRPLTMQIKSRTPSIHIHNIQGTVLPATPSDGRGPSGLGFWLARML